MVSTNAVLLAGLPTAVEKKRDPVHFKQLFYGRSKHGTHRDTHASNRNERFNIVSPGSGDKLVQKFFSS